MKWQPPIPAGALCSPDAVAINIALPLLGWCYDQVGRDGWLDVNLHEVAGAIDVPYHTVKKWWAQLEESSFIKEVDKHGRNGMRVRIADAWLDWRSRDAQHSVPTPVPNPPDDSETIPNMVPNSTQSGLNRDLIGTETRPDMVPNHSGIKVLNNDQESRGIAARKKRTATPAKEPIAGLIIETLRDECKIDLGIAPKLDRDQLYQTAGILARAGAKQKQSPEQIAEAIRYVAGFFRINDWRGKKGEQPKPAQLRSIWAAAIEARNGNLRPSLNGHSERAPQVEIDPDKW